MPIYLPPEPPGLWVPARPAIIRPAADIPRSEIAMLPGMAPIPVRRKWSGKSAYELTGLLGLRSGLKLCLDAGDSASYTSGQPWLDRSGNGYDFNRGATSSSEASDPTFNGTAGGLSASEYFSFDGGDYFTYDSANETAFENIHKAGAKCGIATWVYIPASSGSRAICGTRSANPANVGFDLILNTSDVLSFVVSKGGSPNALSFSIGTITEGAWQFLAVAGDEAAGTFVGMINGAVTVGGSSYTSPSSSAASYTLQLGASGSGVFLPNGSRMAEFLLWEGVTPSQGQLMAYYQASRARFGV
jgi:hypothetical protein